MQADSKQILEAALKLPEEERLALVSNLLDTLPDDPSGLALDDPQLVEELKRRSADRDGATTWDEVRRQL